MNKYEKCVLAVKAKQSKSCERKKWQGNGCYNPWAVCNKSVGSPKKVGRPRKPCPEGQTRDKLSKRCRSKKSRKVSPGKKSMRVPRKPKKVTPSKKSKKVSQKKPRKVTPGKKSRKVSKKVSRKPRKVTPGKKSKKVSKKVSRKKPSKKSRAY